MLYWILLIDFQVFLAQTEEKEMNKIYKNVDHVIQTGYELLEILRTMFFWHVLKGNANVYVIKFQYLPSLIQEKIMEQSNVNET